MYFKYKKKKSNRQDNIEFLCAACYTEYMSRDRHSRRHGNSASHQNQNSHQNQKNRPPRHEQNTLLPHKSLFRPSKSVMVSAEQIQEENDAIRVFKDQNKPVCPHCKQPVDDLTSAIPDKASGEPMHFDCALEILSQSESLTGSDKIVYIGQGRFGVVAFERDQKHFTIKKVIDWESKEAHAPWRNTLCDFYSQTK